MVVELHAFTTGGGAGGSASPDATPYPGSAVSVPTNAEITVASRVVPGGFTFRLTQIIGTGSASAEWILYDNAVEVYRTRTSGEVRGVDLMHGNPIPFAAGHTVAIKAVHQEPSTQNFHATLLGYDS